MGEEVEAGNPDRQDENLPYEAGGWLVPHFHISKNEKDKAQRQRIPQRNRTAQPKKSEPTCNNERRPRPKGLSGIISSSQSLASPDALMVYPFSLDGRNRNWSIPRCTLVCQSDEGGDPQSLEF